MNEDFRTFLNEQDTNSLLDGFPENLSKEHNLTPEQFEEVKRNQSIPDNDPLTGEPWNAGKPKANDLPMPPDYTPEEEEIVDEETGEVTTITKSQPVPKVSTDPNGTYKAFYLAPCNMNKRINDALGKMIAEGDHELAEAMLNSKKTMEGCLRFLNNTLADLGRELKTKGLTAYNDDDIHFVARYYFVNPDCKDTQNIANEVAKRKAEKKPKKETKPKAEPKPKAEKKTKVVPLTPQMGSLFGDEDFQ